MLQFLGCILPRWAVGSIIHALPAPLPPLSLPTVKVGAAAAADGAGVSWGMEPSGLSPGDRAQGTEPSPGAGVSARLSVMKEAGAEVLLVSVSVFNAGVLLLT